ncbi:MAG: tRNA (N6-isopentenyl adenosine(37)-C2)-methylthiotransferase MiaB, partial [Lachnospiraceae bacterium]|nr:tRNA (N6-isopentenyl adenosine(37)-C2)-methylthiotransferase MiaB [Lachnospiraceae bacterium]
MYDSIDLDAVDISGSPPREEPQRQYHYMAKMRNFLSQEEKRLGRRLTACVVTFGCQMNARDSEKLSGILLKVG